jgi:hypothetical protein
MSQFKNDKRVNLHLHPSVHARLLIWCRRYGLTLQDGLATMVDLCAREVNGLKLPSNPEPAPGVLARPIVAKAAPKETAPAPIEANPIVIDPPEETDDERWERERAELDPDALYARELSRGKTIEEAYYQVKQWLSSYDLPEEGWEPIIDYVEPGVPGESH